MWSAHVWHIDIDEDYVLVANMEDEIRNVIRDRTRVLDVGYVLGRNKESKTISCLL